MMTTFRCSFGDCSTIAGTPIFEHVGQKYGNLFIFMYCIFVFSVSIGLFNVISAIFVQSTLAAATAMKSKQQKSRLQDDELWVTRLNTIITRLLEIEGSCGHSP